MKEDNVMSRELNAKVYAIYYGARYPDSDDGVEFDEFDTIESFRPAFTSRRLSIPEWINPEFPMMLRGIPENGGFHVDAEKRSSYFFQDDPRLSSHNSAERYYLCRALKVVFGFEEEDDGAYPDEYETYLNARFSLPWERFVRMGRPEKLEIKANFILSV